MGGGYEGGFGGDYGGGYGRFDEIGMGGYDASQSIPTRDGYIARY